MPRWYTLATVETMSDTDVSATQEDASTESSPSYPARGKWYVVNTLNGHEQKARAGLLARIASLGVQDRIHEVLIPTEKVTEFKKGRKETVERKLYPGYLLVRCDLDDDTWLAICHTPGISGFAGQNQRIQQPVPLSAREVANMLGKASEAPVPANARRTVYSTGEIVRVVNGPFADFVGTVSEVFPGQDRVKIILDIFGRETLVELDFEQVKRP
jgi:transcriptional antiterminator NusG